MANLDQLTKLRERVETMQRESDMAAGALEQSLKRLKSEFSCDTVEDGEKLLKRLRKESDQAEAAFDKAREDFEEKWRDELQA